MPGRMSENMSEYMSDRCQIDCQIEGQHICRIECRMVGSLEEINFLENLLCILILSAHSRVSLPSCKCLLLVSLPLTPDKCWRLDVGCSIFRIHVMCHVFPLLFLAWQKLRNVPLLKSVETSCRRHCFILRHLESLKAPVLAQKAACSIQGRS